MPKRVDHKTLPRRKGGICPSCELLDECPMPAMLAMHKENQETFGRDYKQVAPDLWDEWAIDDPDLSGGVVIWCPMYQLPIGTKEESNEPCE